MRLSSSVINILAFLIGQLAVAQRIAVGVKGGVQIGQDINGITGIATPESKRYIVGPMLEVHLPLRLSFEFDALYRRFGYTRSNFAAFINESPFYNVSRTRANSWEFPMILKYRIPTHRPVHPFVGVGYAPRTVWGVTDYSGIYDTFESPAAHYKYSSGKFQDSYPVTHGVVGSAGVDFGVGHIRISPELRYVHWGGHFLDTYNSVERSFIDIHSELDEFFFLLGISWR